MVSPSKTAIFHTSATLGIYTNARTDTDTDTVTHIHTYLVSVYRHLVSVTIQRCVGLKSQSGEKTMLISTCDDIISPNCWCTLHTGKVYPVNFYQIEKYAKVPTYRLRHDDFYDMGIQC